MAFTFKQETKEERQAKFDENGGEYSRSWIVITEGLVGLGDVAAHCETIGSAHPDDPYALCTDVTARQAEYMGGGQGKWEVTANYSSALQDSNLAQSPLYPIRPAKYSGTGSLIEQIADFDIKGDPILNTAGDPQPVPILVPIYGLDVEVNLPYVFSILPYLGTISKNAFGGLGPGMAQLTNFNYTGPHEEHGITFWTNKFSFGGNPRGYQPVVLSAGLRQLQNGKLINITMPDGTIATSPICLDSSGAAITTGTVAARMKRMVAIRPKIYTEISYGPITF